MKMWSQTNSYSRSTDQNQRFRCHIQVDDAIQYYGTGIDESNPI